MGKSLKDIAIFGAGGFGLEVAMLIEQINTVSLKWRLIGFFDDGIPEEGTINDYPMLGGVDKLNCWMNDLSIVLAMGYPKTKVSVLNKIHNEKINYPILIHPNVVLGRSEFLSIGQGTIICAGNIITTNVKIGKHVILNLACTIGHETEIGDFSSFMPACNISGEVKIGESTFWGTGAKVINRKVIGDNVTIGAGAVVVDDLPDNITAVGVPAKIIKSTDSED